MPAPGLDGPPDNFVGNPAVGLVAEDPLIFEAAEVVAQEAAAGRDVSISQRASHWDLPFLSRKAPWSDRDEIRPIGMRNIPI